MTVSTEINTAGPYIGDGQTKQFAIGFPFLDGAFLKVLLTHSEGETTLVLNQDYEVKKNPQGDAFIQLTQALPTGSELMVTRSTPFTQDAQYVQGDAFSASSHEQVVDKLTMLFQELETDAPRTIKTPDEEDEDIQFPPVENRLNKVLGFDDQKALQPITIGCGIELENNVIHLKNGIGMLSNKQGISLLYGNGIDVYDKAIVIKQGNGLAFDEQSRLEIEETLLNTIQNSSTGLIDLQGLVAHLEKRILDLELEGGGEVTIFIGDGLHYDPEGNLTIKPHTGISVTSDGVSVRIGNGLEIDPSGHIKISDALQKEIADKAEKSNIPKPEDWAGEGLEAKENKLAVAKPEKRFTIIYPNGGSEMAPASVVANSRYVETSPFLSQNDGVFCVAEVFYNGKWGEGQLKSWTTSGGSAIGVGTSAYFFDGAIVVQTGTHQALAGSARQGNAFGIGDISVYFPIPCRVKVWRVD